MKRIEAKYSKMEMNKEKSEIKRIRIENEIEV